MNPARLLPRLRHRADLRTLGFVGLELGLLAVTWSGEWRATLLFLLLPWITAQLALVGVNLLQHQDCDTASEYDHSRKATGRLLNWLLLNNGYHTAHHLRPPIPIVPLAPMEPAVEIRHLVKEFRPAGRKLPLRAVDNASLTVGAGEVYGLIGPNGSGKSISWSIRCPRTRNRNCAPSSIPACPEEGSSI